MNQWSKYKVGDPSEKVNWTNQRCQPLEEVSHVAHLETACRILKDNSIKAGLVFDKSKLNQERILVSWVSPNSWYHGSRYGNVEFVFDFKKLIKGMKYYWVEAMTDYTPHACRILLTKHDYDDVLERYDPKEKDGPWYYDRTSKTHYRNGDYTLEFMVEGNLDLSDCDGLNFVKHHKVFCCIDHTTCKEKGLLEKFAQRRVLAHILSNDINIPDGLLAKDGKPSQPLISAVDEILYLLVRKTGFSKGSIPRPKQSTILQAALNLIWLGKKDEFVETALMFDDFDRFKKLLHELVVEHFRLDSDKELNELWED